MTSALLIEDRLAEKEAQMEEVVHEHGFYVVARSTFLEICECDRPPTAAEIREHLGRGLIENAPMRAAAGVVYWCSEDHRSRPVAVRILYEEHEHSFIQDEIGWAAVITRLDDLGRIRLMSKEDLDLIFKFVKAVG